MSNSKPVRFSKRLDAARLTRGGQSLDYMALWECAGARRARVLIKRDSYPSQSYARVDLWDGNKWNPVTSLPRSFMAVLGTRRDSNGHTVHAVYYGSKEAEVARPLFEEDERSLMAELELIIG